jgi:hypothetical protein
MRALAWISVLVGLLLMAAAITAAGLMATLDGYPDLIDQVLRGEIAQLCLLPCFWQAMPWAILNPHLWHPYLYLTAFMPMAVIVAGVLWAWRRRGAVHLAPAGLLCLLGAALPWATGAFMLARIERPTEAGPWILVMLGGVFWGAIVCVALACWDLGRDRWQRRVAQRTASTSA